jgi:nicotinamide-nucleotide amidase
MGVMFPPEILTLAETVLREARSHGLQLATAESCTGGLIASALTAIPGSSDVVERGFVAHSERAKTELLDIPAEMIGGYGAVSVQVGRAMAEGALAHSAADLSVSCTGIAGPGGGSEAKPVGLVYLGLARRGLNTRAIECRFGALSRDAIRMKTVVAALQLVLDAIRASP